MRYNAPPKYGNRKMKTPDGTFDSAKEYRRWCELKIMERAGIISDLRRQVKYVLVPHQKGENGKIIEREVSYIADFVYTDKTQNKTVVEDTKGYKTEKYIIKRKLMLYIHGIVIQEI